MIVKKFHFTHIRILRDGEKKTIKNGYFLRIFVKRYCFETLKRVKNRPYEENSTKSIRNNHTAKLIVKSNAELAIRIPVELYRLERQRALVNLQNFVCTLSILLPNLPNGMYTSNSKQLQTFTNILYSPASQNLAAHFPSIPTRSFCGCSTFLQKFSPPQED